MNVAITPEISKLLAANAVVAIGVSGGKDSAACALAVNRFLKEIGHAGPQLLIHSDLGRVEWKDSLPSCQRLADKIGWELVTVRRQAGDMLARWQGRWSNNVARYRNLECVKLILPWSTPSMRFCTSELKVAVITSALKKRFPKQPIINVSGIRREESAKRKLMPVSAILNKLNREDYPGLAWNAIIEWPIAAVLSEISSAGLQLHEAYRVFGSSRVSCVYCIMSSASDLRAAAGCADNHDIYREMVALEAESTYAFQGGKWLADAAPHLLSDDLLFRANAAKIKAQRREDAEAPIPKHLLYTKGWPTCMPNGAEADLIASVRRQVSKIVGLDSLYLTGVDVFMRYAQLMDEKTAKDAA